MDDQVSIERDHLRADGPDLLGDPVVARRIGGLSRGMARPSEDHPGRVVERLHARDVGVVEDEGRRRPVSRARRAGNPRASLDVLGLPVGRPVPVHVVAAGRVLVDLAVAVVVQSLRSEQVVFPLLAWLDRDEQSGIVRREFITPVRVLLPHLGDLAVAVEVVVSVLVEQAVAVVVMGGLAASRRAGRVRPVEPVGAAVGVDGRNEVERLLIQEPVDVVEPPVILGQRTRSGRGKPRPPGPHSRGCCHRRTWPAWTGRGRSWGC